MYGYKGEAVVGEDGSFELTVKKPKVKHTMDVKLYFSLSGQSDRHKEMYGPGGEKFDGPFVYQDSNFAEVWNYLGYHFYVDPASPVNTTVSYETPVWDRPADYGEPLVWLKPAVTKDDEFVYIKVKSNLLEGTSVTGDIELPGTTHYGYNDRTQVLPDGSFTLQFPHPKNSKEYDYRIEVIPENPPWPTVRDAYGPNGEKFAGELVKEKELTSRTVKFLELKVKITE
ncbi:hypothetical protein KDJ56_16275 [Brevibacillus composti]|uniref:Uncharacterized protein n=1 Tax=Brevibacillus composti TaxID=2796470 RepID=A0A7T5EIZ8_9BACL|nr:hypothetical protein [Brevibacillus composti]QQE73448.1 hypothetical protein JD108_16330 [Brevibacillus composti]QUO40530.1 hypothetical protein KDJ56_16275 [Brevibacillus composti]